MASAILNETGCSINSVPTVDPNAPSGPVLKIVSGRPVVSSRQVADHFGKQHKNVIRSIEAIIRNAPESFGGLNFERTSYRVEIPNGGGFKDCPAYDMTRDGFVIVAMGFTGKKAILWKIRYVQAFNAMEAEIAGQPKALAAPVASPAIPRRTTAQERNPLAVLVNKLMGEQGPTRPAYIAFWRRFHEVFGVKSVDEITVDQLPRALAFVDALIAFREGVEPKALPAGRPRNNLGDYCALYGGLPPTPQYWMDLLTEYAKASEAFGRKLDEIKAEATKPFRVNRKSGISTYFDEAMSPMYSLFDAAEKNQHHAYCNVFRNNFV